MRKTDPNYCSQLNVNSIYFYINMATISYYIVLSVCVCALAKHGIFEEEDIVHYRSNQNNETDYYMFVTREGVNPESNPNTGQQPTITYSRK
ncbi:uncharacterized protein LOC126847026 isoform X2 [Adelges cooleyi]|uniref:uncharacterized protein LOC126847026 isoform X2 n=1 Tax=Adelges cooleyi TaxID=133065 RepID=UPI00217F4ADB|nr:uncharacterized protein LOC126847026 isoform X2 [Adelges cooleyi]